MMQHPPLVLFLFSILGWQNLLSKIMTSILPHLLERAEPRTSSLQRAAKDSLCISDCSYCKGPSTSASQELTASVTKREAPGYRLMFHRSVRSPRFQHFLNTALFLVQFQQFTALGSQRMHQPFKHSLCNG